jgi:hypothetical protein
MLQNICSSIEASNCNVARESLIPAKGKGKGKGKGQLGMFTMHTGTFVSVLLNSIYHMHVFCGCQK